MNKGKSSWPSGPKVRLRARPQKWDRKGGGGKRRRCLASVRQENEASSVEPAHKAKATGSLRAGAVFIVQPKLLFADIC